MVGFRLEAVKRPGPLVGLEGRYMEVLGDSHSHLVMTCFEAKMNIR